MSFFEHSTATVSLIQAIQRVSKEESSLGKHRCGDKGTVFAPAPPGISIHQHEIPSSRHRIPTLLLHKPEGKPSGNTSGFHLAKELSQFPLIPELLPMGR